jgi:beta-glucanase (GH16 family)
MAANGDATTVGMDAPGDGGGQVIDYDTGPAPDIDAGAGWILAWSDEFNGPNGAPPDPSKWTLVTGGNGWGNQELEYYTTALENAHLENGQLVITALTAAMATNASGYTCRYPMDGGPCGYTSARMQTQGLFSQQYGRIEASIQIPTGQGLWPAFWTLGNNIDTVGWPQCGEMDIQENIGNEPSTNHGSLHALNSMTGKAYENVTATYSLDGGAKLSDGFHVYGVEWQPGQISFYVDGNVYETQTSTGIPAGDAWPYEQPFYLLLNVAVGGNWPGSPDNTTVFPQTMLVDYVRAYSAVGADY